MEPMPPGRGDKGEIEDRVTGTGVLGSAVLVSGATALGGRAVEHEPQVLATPEDPRTLRAGDRVRVVNPTWRLYGRTGVITKPSESKPEKIYVAFQGEALPNRFLPADLEFDIRDTAVRLYGEIMKKHPGNRFVPGLYEFLKSLTDEQWAQLRIGVPPRYIDHIWQVSGGIALRHTQDPSIKKMVIACGNSPLPERAAKLSHPKHTPDTYTIDPEIDLGPTLLGLYGSDPVHLAFLPGNFDVVFIEGLTLLDTVASFTKVPFFLEGFRHLLRDGGMAAFPIGPNGKTVMVWAIKKGESFLAGDYTEREDWRGAEVTPEWLMTKVAEING
ncbi:hypothetical protein [Sphaerisporangium aureirubrum]|uniref:Uncharacterized protein n=1 Tax=Sphaerisporangium aureirubrum TaxID=1544736 RepID=A0ABW1NMU3_9ACTN